MLEIVIEVDTNDGDYVTKISDITESELEKIKPLIQVIKKRKGHNYCTGEMGDTREELEFPEEVFDIFEDVIPHPEYGFHTIESIEISPKVKREKLL